MGRSEARQLLEKHNVLVRLLTRLVDAFETNSDELPSSTYPSHLPQSDQDEGESSDRRATIANLLVGVFGVDPSYVARTTSFLFPLSGENLTEEAVPTPNPPRILVWPAGNTLGRSRFHPFERLFNVITDVAYILGSLTNMRPLYGDSVLPQGWWNLAARSSYLHYIRLLLTLLSYVQVQFLATLNFTSNLTCIASLAAIGEVRFTVFRCTMMMVMYLVDKFGALGRIIAVGSLIRISIPKDSIVRAGPAC
ncbi:unnamed protein product [Echinostoma caproni]|uniref:TRP domain-containing protein n=1 Tax=Echinostoma caproni TaxID=27848 RepID=A0A183B7T0_9TREM|nr:unnamed protein product [Echinostoma caproni]